ncbi:MAG: dicarboxylate/amino acid:cation symporter, partial [Minisyncoccales bacterium]
MTSYRGYEKESDINKKKSYGLFHPEHLAELNKHIKIWVKGRLWLQIIIGMFLGIIAGYFINPERGLFNEKSAALLGEWLALSGEIFITIIQMVVVPLIMVSIIRAIASNKSIKQIKKKGWILLIYLLSILAIAVVIGIVIGMIIQPGSYINADLVSEKEINPVKLEEQTEPLTLSTIPEKVVSLFPGNPFHAMIENQMLQIVILSFILGFALLSLSKKAAHPIMDLLSAIQSVTMVIVKWVMFIAPLAVFGLLAQLMISTGIEVIFGLGIYVVTVLFGLTVLMLFFLIVVFFIGKQNPFKFLSSSKEALLLAFSTDSSAV